MTRHLSVLKKAWWVARRVKRRRSCRLLKLRHWQQGRLRFGRFRHCLRRRWRRGLDQLRRRLHLRRLRLLLYRLWLLSLVLPWLLRFWLFLEGFLLRLLLGLSDWLDGLLHLSELQQGWVLRCWHMLPSGLCHLHLRDRNDKGSCGLSWCNWVVAALSRLGFFSWLRQQACCL